jgi:hypothetical protein
MVSAHGSVLCAWAGLELRGDTDPRTEASYTTQAHGALWEQLLWVDKTGQMHEEVGMACH